MPADRILRSIIRECTPDRQVLSVAEAATLAGMTEKAIRQRIARRTLPFRKLGTRCIFLKHELEEFLTDLPGCSVEEARTNVARRE